MVGERRVAATRTLGSFPVGTTSRSLMEVGGGGGREEGEEGRRGRKGGGRRGRKVYEWEDVEV